MMRKLFVLLLSAFLLVSNASAANTPSDPKNTPFIGFGVLENMYTIYGVPGGTIFGGYRWDELGLELGYTKLLNDDWGERDGWRYKSDNVYLDGLWFYPIHKRFDLIGRAGVGVFRSKLIDRGFRASHWDYDEGTETSVGARLGIGVDYKINNHLHAGLGYTFQTNCNVIIGFLSIYSLELKYFF
jgi:opacity protein-like surface antigen